MKLFSVGFLIGSSALLLSAFPTPENVARLARSGGLEIPEGMTFEVVLDHIQKHKQKRLLVDSLTSPIDGECEFRVPGCLLT
jgi:hypothetical protein